MQTNSNTLAVCAHTAPASRAAQGSRGLREEPSGKRGGVCASVRTTPSSPRAHLVLAPRAARRLGRSGAGPGRRGRAGRRGAARLFPTPAKHPFARASVQPGQSLKPHSHSGARLRRREARISTNSRGPDRRSAEPPLAGPFLVAQTRPRLARARAAPHPGRAGRRGVEADRVRPPRPPAWPSLSLPGRPPRGPGSAALWHPACAPPGMATWPRVSPRQ